METQGETKAISESEAKVLRSLTRRYILASSLAQIALPHRVRRLLHTHRQRNYPALLSMPIGYATLVSPPASAPRTRSGTISDHWLLPDNEEGEEIKKWTQEGNGRRKEEKKNNGKSPVDWYCQGDEALWQSI